MQHVELQKVHVDDIFNTTAVCGLILPRRVNASFANSSSPQQCDKDTTLDRDGRHEALSCKGRPHLTLINEPDINIETHGQLPEFFRLLISVSHILIAHVHLIFSLTQHHHLFLSLPILDFWLTLKHYL